MKVFSKVFPLFRGAVLLQKLNGSAVETNSVMDAIDTIMVCRMRLILAVSILLTAIVQSSEGMITSTFTWLVFIGYVVSSMVMYGHAYLRRMSVENWLVNWIDIFWCVLIVSSTGGIHSIYFFLFFFSILTTSFRFGFEKGAQIAIASAVMFITIGMLSDTEPDLSKLLLRTIFLLIFGYMCALWGESKVVSKQRIALLRDVVRLSNPRFGVDHTISSVLEKTRRFFKGNACILVLYNKNINEYVLHTKKQGSQMDLKGQAISAHVANALMSFSDKQVVLSINPLWPKINTNECVRVYDNEDERWEIHNNAFNNRIADLIESPYYISSPVSLNKGKGRIYVTSAKDMFNKSDAIFLNHIVQQTFPVIDNIGLLDRIASEAASEERKKIAWDLHDAAIQPYIGLKFALSALRIKATDNNPIADDLDKLIATANQLIIDLRGFASSIKSTSCKTESILLPALQRSVLQMKELYGLDIAIKLNPSLHISDRLAVEVLYLINEGLSNICKHTSSQRGSIHIGCEQNWIKMLIQNEGDGTWRGPFTPHSISERASALGGDAQVELSADGSATVQITIPV